MTADIVTEALTMAWFRRKPAVGLMHHSERGSQYASHAFQNELKAYGMVCSMSRKGNCWDHAPAESWFNSFTNERVHGLRYATRAAMTAASFEYIEVFSSRTRRYSTLGCTSLMQFLDDWRMAQHEKTLVACNPPDGRRTTEGSSCASECLSMMNV
jgi:transposase InsO family protein